ncbi:MAG TPA: ATP-dependent DNA helicase [Spirochaetia bacterium]|nr:ATP-dependent DNA helicase [Spirochaetia bacterium]
MDIGVRELVETVLPSGDLHSARLARRLMQAGMDAHALVRSDRPDGYQSEVGVSLPVRLGQEEATLRGRIDGLLLSESSVTIEEIKSTAGPLADVAEGGNATHRAQAMVYAAMFCSSRGLDGADVTLTYYSLRDHSTRSFTTGYTRRELSERLSTILDSYAELIRWERERRADRDRSVRALAFPFASRRKGQDDLMAAVEAALRDGGRLLVRAATGIGKTLAVLYPSIRSLADGSTARIFYLTARGTGRGMAEETLGLLCEQGARLRCVTITARDAICFQGPQCHTEECPFARGYYDRLGLALADARVGGIFNRQRIEELARRHTVCPFELSLDLTLSADCIVCDYNYLFDPRVSLQRFFARPEGNSVFLVDEAHNLVDRVRAMYSASLSKRALVAGRRHVDRKLHRQAHQDLGRINDWLLSAKRQCGEENVRYRAAEDAPRDLIELVERSRESLEPVLFDGDAPPLSDGRQELLELYFSLGGFLQTAESFGSAHAAAVQCASGDTVVSLLCLDPSRFIRASTDKGRATVFFSATLTPIASFLRAFGAEPSDPGIDVPSPFPPSNLLVLLDDTVSTRLLDRPSTLDRVAQDLAALCAGDGNYLAFFPSYAYLEAVLPRFQGLAPRASVLAQRRELTAEDREAFLSRFTVHPDGTLVGFAVLGGIFAEGIDLPGERLVGAAVVGVGLPAVTPERELIRGYYARGEGTGAREAYELPGLARVLQAAGRLIRTETDRGVLLLVDDRYAGRFYQESFPPEWRDHRRVRTASEIARSVDEFRGARPTPQRASIDRPASKD